MTPVTDMYGTHPESMIPGIDKSNTPADISVLTPHLIDDFRNADDVLAIYAGFMTGPEGKNITNMDVQHLIDYLQQKYEPHMRLVFDNLHEGNVDIVVCVIHEAISKLNIDPKKVHYVSGATDAVSQYLEFCSRNNIVDRINIWAAGTWEHAAKNNATILGPVEFQIKPRQKNYLCFNRVCRNHRLMLLSMLLKENLVSNGYYSFFPEKTHGTDVNIDVFFNNLKYLLRTENSFVDELRDVYNNNLNIFPLKVNIDSDHNKVNLDNEDAFFYKESYFSLVTETFYFEYDRGNHHGKSLKDENTIFFSEKVFKPIIMKHPFILVSRPNALAYLRSIGYKTFHPFIDESYDSIIDDKKRMEAIVAEVKRLSNYTENQWLDWLRNVRDICIYNREALVNKTNFLYEKLI